MFDPKTNQFTALPPMTGPRSDAHRAVRLQDGRVLIVGGDDGVNGLRTAEIFDPSSRTFTVVGSMATTRAKLTTTLLTNGRVLAAGGWSREESGPTQTAELFDPASGQFQAAGSMTVRRYGHSAALLPDGRVAILGGWGPDGQALRSVEIYDPDTGAFTAQGELVEARAAGMAVLLTPDGRILVAAGRFANASGKVAGVRKSAEIYDPATGQSAITDALTDARHFPAAAPLADGTLLVAGGSTGSAAISTAEVIDPTTGRISPTASMTAARGNPAAAALLDGRILILGGWNGDGSSLATAEVYVPATASSDTPP
jgi:hypothetical protein